MKTKNLFVYLFFVIVFSTMLFFLFYNNTLKMNSSLGAAVTPVAEDDTVLLNADKKMVNENIDDFEGEKTITVKDLIESKYMTGEEINPLTDEIYDYDIRIISFVENGEVKDIYIKPEPFKNVFNCTELCYINDNNYITFNNEVYQIIKVDSEGHVYITAADKIFINKDNIDKRLKSLYYSYDKKMVKDVITVSYKDIESSDIINGEEDLFVNTSYGYQLYNSISTNIEEVGNIKSNLIPVIILNNDITYENGDGSKFKPYVVN